MFFIKDKLPADAIQVQLVPVSDGMWDHVGISPCSMFWEVCEMTSFHIFRTIVVTSFITLYNCLKLTLCLYEAAKQEI